MVSAGGERGGKIIRFGAGLLDAALLCSWAEMNATNEQPTIEVYVYPLSGQARERLRR
jgi:hypothetical protein